MVWGKQVSRVSVNFIGIGRDTASGRMIVHNLIGSTETREFDTTKDIDSGIDICPRDPREIPLIKKARPLNSARRIPYLYGVGAESAGKTVDAVRARTARFM
jgi:hypothetical protein